MATSGVYTVTITGKTLFTMVLKELGVLAAAGATAKAPDITDVKERANLWLLSLNGKPNTLRPGEMMWTRESGELTLSTSSAEYDLKPSGGDLAIQIPSAIHSIQYRDSDDNDTDLKWMSWEKYKSIHDKDGTGTPQEYHYQRRDDTGKLYLDVVPDVANSLIINYQQPLEIIDDTANEFDCDPSWHLALLYNIAYHCAGIFSVPMDRTAEIKSNAAAALKVVSDIFPDDSDFCIRPARR